MLTRPLLTVLSQPQLCDASPAALQTSVTPDWRTDPVHRAATRRQLGHAVGIDYRNPRGPRRQAVPGPAGRHRPRPPAPVDTIAPAPRDLSDADLTTERRALPAELRGHRRGHVLGAGRQPPRPRWTIASNNNANELIFLAVTSRARVNARWSSGRAGAGQSRRRPTRCPGCRASRRTASWIRNVNLHVRRARPRGARARVHHHAARVPCFRRVRQLGRP